MKKLSIINLNMHLEKFSCFLITCFVLILISLFFVACNKEDDEIGLNIVGSNNFIIHRDTLYVTASTEYQDSIVSSGFGDTETNLIGCIFDPVLGKTSSSLAVNFGLSTTDPQFTSDDKVDSVVLSFAYSGGYYGDINCPQTFRVYELQEVLSGTYYSNHRCKHSSIEIGKKTFIPNFDSVTINGKTVAPSLQIRLNKSIGTRVLQGDSASLSSNENFANLLNGIYIAPDPVNTPGSGALLKFLLAEDQTYITIYYHNDTVYNLSYSLNVDKDDCARMLEYNHNNYNNAAQSVKAAIGNVQYGNDKLFLQSMAGLRVKVNIPKIDSIAALGTIAVSSAVLSFYVDSNESFFTAPSTFDLVMINEDGSTTSIADYSEGTSHYNGNYDTKTGKINLRIQRQMQKIFYGSVKNNGFYLVIRNSSYVPGRTVLYGANPSDISKRIMLDMTYSVVVTN